MKISPHLTVHKLSPKRLNIQLGLIFSILLAASFSVFTYYSSNAEIARITDNMKSQADVLVRNLAATTGDSLLARDYTSIELSLLRLAQFPGIRNIQVSDKNGHLVGDVVHNKNESPEVRFGNLPITPPTSVSHKIITGHTTMTIWQSIDLGERLGWVRVVYSLEEINKITSIRWKETLYAGSLVIGITMTLLLLFLMRPMKSIASYTDFAAQLDISEGKSIALDKSSVELEKLGNALNWASHKLHEQNQKIQIAVTDLKRLAAFPEMNPNIVLSIDESGRVQYINPYAYDLIKEFNIDDQGIQPLLPENINQIVKKCIVGKCNPKGIEVTFRDRTFFWTFSPVSGQHIMHGYAMEITERIKAEEKVQAARVDALSAVAANNAKSQFLANMSHELRTPLNAIIGYSEILEEDADDRKDQTAKTDISHILQAARHLLSVINDILDLSKVESGQTELYLEEFNLHELTDNIVSTTLPLAKSNHNELLREDDIKTMTIYSDKTKLKQILFNLLGNAFKFTQHGKIVLKTSEIIDSEEKNILFEVVDDGIGMTEEQMQKIFRPFSQADDSTTRKYGGTGLGLAISKAYCEMLGGSISVHSRLGEGTTFRVILPKKDIQKT